MACESQRLAPIGRTGKLGLIAEILRVYAVVRWRMRRSDIRTMVAELRGDADGRPRGSNFPLARRLAKAVVRTLGFLPTDNRCLARSLVLDSMLTKRSLQSVLVLAARTEPTFAAHAWVEHDGVPLLPPGSDDYQRLIEI
jgi:hypothetical protein